MKGRDSDETGRDESEEARCGYSAEAVEDEGVGDVERAGDEQAEQESFGEAAACVDAVHAGDCRLAALGCPRSLQ
jgi:hypothetical protein